MNYFYKYFLFFFFVYSGIVSSFDLSDDIEALTGKWMGIEVMGSDKATAQKVRDLLPIKIGDPIVIGEAGKFRATCSKLIQEKMNFPHANCSYLIYGEQDMLYLLVELAEPKAIFRTIPKKKIQSRLPYQLKKPYKKLEERVSFLLSQLITSTEPITEPEAYPLREIYENGFMDFQDSILHNLSLKIHKYAYKYNDVLLDILCYSQDGNERAKAAKFLAWAEHHEKNLRLILERKLLLDPNQGVRNNIARAFSHTIEKVKDKALLKELLPVYCHLATLPSHMDRNKALFSIEGILQASPESISSISPECKNTITYISEMSILDNVGGIAKDILTMISDTKQPKSMSV